jgi:hypothetical protein
MGAITNFFRNISASLFNRADPLDRLATYIIREHERGRTLDEIMDDPYVRNRTTPAERARLLDNPAIIHAIGKDVVASTRSTLDS